MCRNDPEISYRQNPRNFKFWAKISNPNSQRIGSIFLYHRIHHQSVSISGIRDIKYLFVLEGVRRSWRATVKNKCMDLSHHQTENLSTTLIRTYKYQVIWFQPVLDLLYFYYPTILVTFRWTQIGLRLDSKL